MLPLIKRTRVLVLAALLPLSSAFANEQAAIIDANSIFNPIVAENGMVVAQESRAANVGLAILKQGGNAIDAAVAVGFSLAVTLPKAGNIGGGGFMMVYLQQQQKVVAIDYREMAPLAAHRDMYLDAEGEVDKQRSRYTHRAAGIPGTVAGLLMVLEKYGTMRRQQVLAPAIKLAREGFILSPAMADEIASRRQQLSRSNAGRAMFFKANGDAYQAGERFYQKDLAWSLEQISQYGSDAFYRGEVAARLVADAKKNDGLWTLQDFADYQAVQRQPIHGRYRGIDVYSMPPPSSGGIHLVQMLNTLENFDLSKLGHNSADYLQLLTESMKYAYADRSVYLGDPDFTDIPKAKLTSKAYGQILAQQIDIDQAKPSTAIKPGANLPYESHDTTHFSVADKAGNMVSNTYTINFSYGSGIVAEGTGILLNNEMDDFSAKPGTPNAYGLLGGEANAIAPRKRPLSSMTPTLLLKDGRPYIATGSPGGSRIINVVLQIILNTVDFKMNIADAASRPRIHHQWFPDVIQYEQGMSPDTLHLLKSKGQSLKQSTVLGNTQSIMVVDGRYEGAADPRRYGSTAVGY